MEKIWTKKKLDIFEKYLRAYSKIMNKQKDNWLKNYHYIDAFAGSGYFPYDEKN